MAGERACGMGSGFNSQGGEFEFFEVVFLSGPVSASRSDFGLGACKEGFRDDLGRQACDANEDAALLGGLFCWIGMGFKRIHAQSMRRI